MYFYKPEISLIPFEKYQFKVGFTLLWVTLFNNCNIVCKLYPYICISFDLGLCIERLLTGISKSKNVLVLKEISKSINMGE